MLKIKIHEFALNELNEAIEWYDLQSQGLGAKFKLVAKSQVNKIAENPSWFLKEEGNIHKAYLPKFPYKILFSFNKSEVVVWAISHMHRKPRYWQSRILTK